MRRKGGRERLLEPPQHTLFLLWAEEHDDHGESRHPRQVIEEVRGELVHPCDQQLKPLTPSITTHGIHYVVYIQLQHVVYIQFQYGMFTSWNELFINCFNDIGEHSTIQLVGNN